MPHIFLLFIIIIPLIVWLQVYFSKFNNIWLGLILPNITFSISLILTVIDILDRNSLTGKDNSAIIFQFLLINILTVVFVAVYFINRKRKNKQFEKMSIQDL